jgi:hypothetical protein
MDDALLGFIVVGIVIAIMLVTLYGGALALTENFWLGVILLILLPPVFFIWAFFRGLTGK